MVLEYVLFLAGLGLLVKGADYFVEGASSLAKKYGVPSLVIGLTIVAFGTSMPELLVNIFAALEGTASVAFGNVIGSNISNLLLVLGLTAIIAPIALHHNTVWKEIPFSLLAIIVLFVVSNDFIIDQLSIFALTRTDGIIMLIFFAIFAYYIFTLAKHNKKRLKDKKIKIKTRSSSTTLAMIIGGLVGLVLGGQLVVSGAVFIAQQFGLSEFMISATIVAIGTSLPEIVTSVTAAFKKDVDLAIGNIVGSNIFNIFWVLGITSLIAPVTIPNFVNFDILFLMFVTVLLFAFMFIGHRHKMKRWQGVIFVVMYVLYLIFLILRG